LGNSAVTLQRPGSSGFLGEESEPATRLINLGPFIRVFVSDRLPRWLCSSGMMRLARDLHVTLRNQAIYDGA